jgi:hypothetical protein
MCKGVSAFETEEVNGNLCALVLLQFEQKEKFCLDIVIYFCVLSALITEAEECANLECQRSGEEVTCIT